MLLPNLPKTDLNDRKQYSIITTTKISHQIIYFQIVIQKVFVKSSNSRIGYLILKVGFWSFFFIVVDDALLAKNVFQQLTYYYLGHF